MTKEETEREKETKASFNPEHTIKLDSWGYCPYCGVSDLKSKYCPYCGNAQKEGTNEK